jgi:hypothetical protein
MRTHTGITLAAAALLAASMTVLDARARDHGREREDEHEDHGSHRRSGRAPAIDPTYAKECGSCHVAYPPGMLPAASWRGIMAGLDRHFGQDAALEPDVAASIERWLVASAQGGTRTAAGAPLRITALPWFVDEHDEVPAGAVARPSIRSMANCAACHPGAESWDFDEDRAKIPGR